MLTKDYVIGLVDGEGSFTVYVRNPNKSVRTKNGLRGLYKLKQGMH